MLIHIYIWITCLAYSFQGQFDPKMTLIPLKIDSYNWSQWEIQALPQPVLNQN